MRNNKKWVALICALILVSTTFTGCSFTSSSTAKTDEKSSEEPIVATPLTLEYKDNDLDESYEDATSTHIILEETNVSIDGTGAKNEGSVVTINTAGTYIISGTLTDGQIIVDASNQDSIKIVLNNVALTCSTSAPILVKQADKLILTLPEGTNNTITDGRSGTNTEETKDEIDAAIFSKDDLTINGAGSLNVTGNFDNGIHGKDDVVIIHSAITITSGANGLVGKDSVTCKDAALTITSGEDGIHSNNTESNLVGYVVLDGGIYTIDAQNDALQAESVLQIEDGTYTLTTNGGSANAVVKTNADDFGGRGGRDSGGHDGGGRGNGDRGDFNPDMEKPTNDTNEEPPELPDKMPTEDATTTDAPNETVDGGSSPSALEDNTTESFKALKASTIFIHGGTFSIDSADDGIHANAAATVTGGTFVINAGGDAIHADTSLDITNGTIDIQSSYEGLESAKITISGGDIQLVSSDDGINAADANTTTSVMEGPPSQDASSSTGSIEINGGNLLIDATGDGIDANGSILITGGTTFVNGPTNDGNGAIDYDTTFDITGGTFIAVGSSGMAQTPSTSSTQASSMIYFSSTQSAASTLIVKDESEHELVSFTPSKEFTGVLISTPEMTTDNTYTLSYGDSQVSITLSDIITSISDTGEVVTKPSFNR